MALDPRIALMGRSVEVPDVVVRRGQRAQALRLEQEAAEAARQAEAERAAAEIIAREGVTDESIGRVAGTGANKVALDWYARKGQRRLQEQQGGAAEALGQYRGEQSLTEQQKRARADSLLPGELALQTENITKAQQETGVAEPSPKMRLDQQKIQSEIAAGFPAFAEAYMQANPNAKPMDVQYAYARRAQAPRAGRDVPLPQEVLDQQLQIKRTGAPRTSVTVNGPRELFKEETTLRKEFGDQPIVKAYNEVGLQYARAKEAMKLAQDAEKSGKSANAPDQTLVMTFNKILDQASVVRETEYERVAAGQSLLNQLKGKFNQIMRGGAGLSSSERKSLIENIESLNKAVEGQYRPVVDQYRGLAQSYDFEPNRITKPITPVEADFNAKKGTNAKDPLGIR